MMPESTDSGLDEELYSDDSDKGESDAAEEKSEPADSVDEEAAEHSTALLPASALGKVKAGDTVTMKVVKLHGDEIEVAISSSTKDDEEPETKTDEEELLEMDSMKA